MIDRIIGFMFAPAAIALTGLASLFPDDAEAATRTPPPVIESWLWFLPLAVLAMIVAGLVALAITGRDDQ